MKLSNAINIRQPAVAGSFYPRNRDTLKQVISDFLIHTQSHLSQNAKAFIVPHAGYQYSGSTAAEVYAQLKRQKAHIHRVVLLGPCHRVWIPGMAIPSSDRFATPLGEIPIDSEQLGRIAQFPQVSVSDEAHFQEHSLEVQLPFLQQCLDDFVLIPIAVGDADVEAVADVIRALWDLPETVFVISSDLSHFLTYQDANRVDQQTTSKILARDYRSLDHNMACGCTPIQGLLAVAEEKSLQVKLLKQCNSGDTSGEKSRVVGYAAYAIF